VTTADIGFPIASSVTFGGPATPSCFAHGACAGQWLVASDDGIFSFFGDPPWDGGRE